MPMVSKRVSASASGSASTTLAGRTKLWVTRPRRHRGRPKSARGFAAALGRRWRVAHNSTGPTTAEGGLNLTRKRSGLHLMNALLRSWVSGPPLRLSRCHLAKRTFDLLDPGHCAIQLVDNRLQHRAREFRELRLLMSNRLGQDLVMPQTLRRNYAELG